MIGNSECQVVRQRFESKNFTYASYVASLSNTTTEDMVRMSQSVSPTCPYLSSKV